MSKSTRGEILTGGAGGAATQSRHRRLGGNWTDWMDWTGLSGKLAGASMRSKDLAKASGLDLRQPQGAQVGDLVRPGESEQEPNRASKRATHVRQKHVLSLCRFCRIFAV